MITFVVDLGFKFSMLLPRWSLTFGHIPGTVYCIL